MPIQDQNIQRIAVAVNKEQKRLKRKRRLKQLGGVIGTGFGALAVSRLKGVRRFATGKKVQLRSAVTARAIKAEKEATGFLSRIIDNAVKQSIKGIFKRRP